MARHLPAEEDNTSSESQRVATLVGDIIGDVQKLVRQEMQLAKAELRQEWTKTKAAAAAFSIAAVLALVAVFLLGIALAEGLVALGLDRWLAYGIVTVVLGGVAYALYAKGRDEQKRINLVPKQTVETLKENVQWIRNQT